MTRQRGFTLIEMMVVVAILAILTTAVVLMVNGKTQPIDVSTRIGNMVREGSRRAVSNGPVRADVQTVTGCGKARTKITSTGTAYMLDMLVEGATGACSWTRLETYTLPAAVTTDSYSVAVGARSAIALSTTWTSFSIGCYASGICDSASLFFQRASGPARQSRVSALPLGGAVYVRQDWN